MITKEDYQKTLIRMWDSVREGDNNMGKPNCGGVSCDRCPLYNNGDDVCGAHASYRAYDAVSIVVEWGKEHSIKTNRDVFAEIMQEKFGDIFNIPYIMGRLEDTCRCFSADCPGGCECSDCEQRNFWDREYTGVSKDADSN